MKQKLLITCLCLAGWLMPLVAWADVEINEAKYPDAKFRTILMELPEGKDGVFRAIAADGKIVGNISVEQKTDVYRKDGEIGYLLLTAYRSKGIMTEAVRQICKIAFSELDIIRITGLVYAPNTASRRVLEKNAFVQEGLQRNAVYKDGKVYDLCLYGKLK